MGDIIRGIIITTLSVIGVVLGAWIHAVGVMILLCSTAIFGVHILVTEIKKKLYEKS
jgi:hypothetical protein